MLDAKGLPIVATYNAFGHRTAVTDPSSGTSGFTYNGHGELLQRTDATPRSTTHHYDLLGRMWKRTWSEPRRNGGGNLSFVETTTYDNNGTQTYGTVASVERLGQAQGAAGEREHYRAEFAYDALVRPSGRTVKLQVGSEAGSEVVLEDGTRYDSRFGRVKQLTYPASALSTQAVSVYQYYNDLGMAVREGFAADYDALNPHLSPAIHAVTGMDGRGLVTAEQYGVVGTAVDWRATQTYDRSGWLLAQCVNKDGQCSYTSMVAGQGNMPLDQRYRFDVYGNLVKQAHNGQWMTGTAVQNAGAVAQQTYTYDALMRLVTHTRQTGLGGSVAVNYDYDEVGGLKKKTDYSTNSDTAYQYVANSHRLHSVALAAGGTASFHHDLNGNVTHRIEPSGTTLLQYDIDNLPRRIERGAIRSDFYEGPGGRWLQRLYPGTGVRDTWMLDKAYERETSGPGGSVRIERYYLPGSTLLTIEPGATAESGPKRTLTYLHVDRLGSPVSLSEKALADDGKLGTAQPVLTEHRGFDPFGKALDGQWGTSNGGLLTLWSGGTFNEGKRNQRGFTGHDHLDEFAIIHMNGRAYDYNLGRFLGVDPFVQFPSNSQSLNPYGYLMNNPLAGTDPTGYEVECFDDGDGEYCRMSISDLKTVVAEGGELIGTDHDGNMYKIESISKASDFESGGIAVTATPGGVSPETIGQFRFLDLAVNSGQSGKLNHTLTGTRTSWKARDINRGCGHPRNPPFLQPASAFSDTCPGRRSGHPPSCHAEQRNNAQRASIACHFGGQAGAVDIHQTAMPNNGTMHSAHRLHAISGRSSESSPYSCQ